MKVGGNVSQWVGTRTCVDGWLSCGMAAGVRLVFRSSGKLSMLTRASSGTRFGFSSLYKAAATKRIRLYPKRIRLYPVIFIRLALRESTASSHLTTDCPGIF